eukprot:TRINITY_DN7976_c0_g1_i1.p1 TRINITY_DN7976_c0_g1~~TRINITY_DN7976_c0_g1_i1.p1  ORF type:complete len:561 (+),score=44.48 TRINITY_DN7976_c0_g1_i1:33-1715(+)
MKHSNEEDINEENASCFSRQNMKIFLPLAVSFFSLGLVVSCLGPLVRQIELQTDASTFTVAFVFLGRTAGYAVGSGVCSLLLSRINKHNPLVNGCMLLLIATNFAIFPWMSALWHALILTSVLGFASGWLDTSVNRLTLSLFGEHLEDYTISVHLCFGVGAALAPIVLWQVNLKFDTYYWGICAIAVASGIAAVINFMSIFFGAFENVDSSMLSDSPPSIQVSRPKKLATPNRNSTTATGTVSAKSSKRKFVKFDDKIYTPLESTSTNTYEDSNNHNDDDTLPLLDENTASLTQPVVIQTAGWSLFIAPFYTHTFMILFASVQLFLFAGVHGTMDAWLWSWSIVSLLPSSNSTIPDVTPKANNIFPWFNQSDDSAESAAYVLTSFYWISFCFSRLVFMKFVNSKWAHIFLSFCLFGGTLLSSLTVIFPYDATITWISIPFLAVFISGLFPSAVVLPNHYHLWIRSTDGIVMSVATYFGEALLPLLSAWLMSHDITIFTGFFMDSRNQVLGMSWLIFGIFVLGIIILIFNLIYNKCSGDMQRIRSSSYNQVSTSESSVLLT